MGKVEHVDLDLLDVISFPSGAIRSIGARSLANVTSRWRFERPFGVTIDKTAGCHAPPLDSGHLEYP
jgi:hypothetical protein